MLITTCCLALFWKFGFSIFVGIFWFKIATLALTYYFINSYKNLVELYVIVKSISYFAMLDEPFTHLNPIQIEKVKKMLVVERENKGLLVTDHMYRHVIDICDSLYVLANGKTHLTNNIEDIELLGYARL